MFPILTYLKIGVAVILLGGVIFGEVKIYDAGYNSAQRACESRLQAIKDASAREVAKEQEVNQKALSEAHKQVSQLQEENDNLNKELSDADVQAFKDHDAQRKCLGVDSVRRINSIGRKH